MDCQYAFLDGQAVSAMIVGDVERCRSAASQSGTMKAANLLSLNPMHNKLLALRNTGLLVHETGGGYEQYSLRCICE